MKGPFGNGNENRQEIYVNCLGTKYNYDLRFVVSNIGGKRLVFFFLFFNIYLSDIGNILLLSYTS